MRGHLEDGGCGGVKRRGVWAGHSRLDGLMGVGGALYVWGGYAASLSLCFPKRDVRENLENGGREGMKR